MMTFTDLLQLLFGRAKREAENTAAQYLRGELTRAEAATSLVIVARKHIAEGEVIGYASCLEVLRDIEETPEVLESITMKDPEDPTDRLTLAAASVMDKPDEEIVMAAGRLVACEAVEKAQDAFAFVLEQSEKVQGWTRRLESDACQLCRWWWREGRVWPKDYTIQTHKGCTCSQHPVTILEEDLQRPGKRAWAKSEERKQQKETAK